MTNDLAALKDRIDLRLNSHLCEMKEGYDDSIVGFNEAWGIVRAAFADAVTAPPPAGQPAAPEPDWVEMNRAIVSDSRHFICVCAACEDVRVSALHAAFAAGRQQPLAALSRQLAETERKLREAEERNERLKAYERAWHKGEGGPP